MATVTFTNGNDTLIVDNVTNSTNGVTLDFGAGNDVFVNQLRGQFEGLDGADMGAGDDQIQLAVFEAGVILGGDGNDLIIVDSGTDGLGVASGQIDAGAGDDVIVFNTNNNTLFTGGAGNDFFFAKGSSVSDLGTFTKHNTLDGGDGIDFISYDRAETTGVVSLLQGAANYGGRGPTNDPNELLSGFENVIGSTFADGIEGDNGNNILIGLAGNDDIFGLGGNDTIDGGSGINNLDGGANTDILVIEGSKAGLSITQLQNGGLQIRGTGDDGLAFQHNAFNFEQFMVNNQLLTRQQLLDTNFQVTNPAAKNAALFAVPQQNLGAGPGNTPTPTDPATPTNPSTPPDSGTSGEVIIGTKKKNTLNGTDGDDVINGKAGNDKLKGNAGNDLLLGGKGNDKVSGGAGSDVLNGGKGKDSLTGGAGADFFIFESAGKKNTDTINGFVSGVDGIAISAVLFDDLASGPLAENAFKIIGNGGSVDADDRVIYNADSGKLFIDVDGAGGDGAIQIAKLTGAPAMAFSDIVIV
jgi:serralysin